MYNKAALFFAQLYFLLNSCNVSWRRRRRRSAVFFLLNPGEWTVKANREAPAEWEDEDENSTAGIRSPGMWHCSSCCAPKRLGNNNKTRTVSPVSIYKKVSEEQQQQQQQQQQQRTSAPRVLLFLRPMGRHRFSAHKKTTTKPTNLGAVQLHFLF